jgi:toxin CcdB
MTQFDVFRNPNPDTRGRYPLLLDVQSELLSSLATRVVIPLCPAAPMKEQQVNRLMPSLEVDGRDYAMLTPQLAGVSRKHLGTKVGSLSRCRAEIIQALDVLIVGI